MRLLSFFFASIFGDPSLRSARLLEADGYGFAQVEVRGSFQDILTPSVKLTDKEGKAKECEVKHVENTKIICESYGFEESLYSVEVSFSLDNVEKKSKCSNVNCMVFIPVPNASLEIPKRPNSRYAAGRSKPGYREPPPAGAVEEPNLARNDDDNWPHVYSITNGAVHPNGGALVTIEGENFGSKPGFKIFCLHCLN